MNSPFTISQADGRPMYLQLIEQVKQLVAVGDWPPGTPLPSIRQLAVDLQVSVITVKRAYLELEREGVIVTRHGKGSYVGDQPELGALRRDELDGHLRGALRVGRLLGMSRREIEARLRAVDDDAS